MITRPTIPPHAECSYETGFVAGQESIRAALHLAFPSVPIAPRPALLSRCQECRHFLEIGEPVRPTHTDAYGNTLWSHIACQDTEPEPEPDIVVPAAPVPDRTARVQALRQVLDHAGAGDLKPYSQFLADRYPELDPLRTDQQATGTKPEEHWSNTCGCQCPSGPEHCSYHGPDGCTVHDTILITTPEDLK